MDELIKRLEKATDADRELDMQIFEALHPGSKRAPHGCVKEPVGYHDAFRKQRCPAFTGSLDAALTLVPTDGHVSISGVNQSWDVLVADTPQNRRYPPSEGFSGVTAIALCIAAMKARRAFAAA